MRMSILFTRSYVYPSLRRIQAGAQVEGHQDLQEREDRAVEGRRLDEGRVLRRVGLHALVGANDLGVLVALERAREDALDLREDAWQELDPDEAIQIPTCAPMMTVRFSKPRPPCWLWTSRCRAARHWISGPDAAPGERRSH